MTKRRETESLREVQHGNQSWWTTHTMSYDWRDRVEHPRFSAAWYDDIDQRFVEAAKLFAHDRSPFDRIIPFDAIAGKRVLEIGCGMGLHTELMTRAGAAVTAVDLSPTSIEATTKRLELKGLEATLIHGDAESVDLPDDHFDFIWSWGVIHHSSHTGRIVRNLARVLKRDGELRAMVYNRESFAARYALVRHYWLGGAFLSKTYDEVLHEQSDGYSARFYPPEQFADLLRAFFRDVDYEVMGQLVDAVPVPRLVRAPIARWLGERWATERQRKWGAFIFATARNVL
jgi:2-polyprenyl-3-methyl-5-hydroxy-6-metoxy-1,4-benzoquinol methylase